MFLYYRPKTSEVVMRSEGKNETDLPFIEVEPTEDEKTKIEQNYEIFVKNGKIHLEVPQHIKKELKMKSQEELKQKIHQANSIQELRELVISLIE